MRLTDPFRVKELTNTLIAKASCELSDASQVRSVFPRIALGRTRAHEYTRFTDRGCGFGDIFTL
jgi:hypothetical protein